MPENMEAFIEKSKVIQTEILEKAKERKIKILYLKHQKFNIESRMLLLLNFVDANAGIVYQENFTTVEYYDIYLLHRNRLKSVLDILNTEDMLSTGLIYGWLDTDNVLHTAEVKKQMNFEPNYEKGIIYHYLGDDKYLVQEKECEVVICSDCGKRMFNVSNVIKTEDGRIYCSDCAERLNIGVCDLCGKVHIRKQIEMTPDSLLRGHKLGDKINICNGCIGAHYYFCEDCGTPVRKPKTRCAKCESSVILSYSTKPEPIFKAMRNENTRLYFGWEWEIESKGNPRDISYIANTKGKGLMYCKHDGSIRNGVEIVTHPMTYNFFRSRAKFFRDLFSDIKNAGGHSFDTSNTGCHIHISRAGFKNADHIINFTRCVYQSKFSEFIALRPGNHYAHYNGFSVPSIRKQLINPCDRYRAVNFCNRNTIEVRIYKGTINYDALMMYIQHLMCCIKYAETMKVGGRFHMEDFLKFIESQPFASHKMLRARTKAYKDLYIKYSPEE